MVYFYAFARPEIFLKNARKSGVGRGQFEPGVNGLKILHITQHEAGALHKHERGNKKGWEIEKRTANVQIPWTVRVVLVCRPLFWTGPVLHCARHTSNQLTSQSIKRKKKIRNHSMHSYIKIAPHCRLAIDCVRYLEKMPSKKHKITRYSRASNKIIICKSHVEKTFCHWLALTWPIGVVFDLSTIFINPMEFSEVAMCSSLIPSSFVKISHQVVPRPDIGNSVVVTVHV